MKIEKYKENLARNITNLRKAHQLTQFELANHLGYSDKTISKWERAEGLPDVIVLKQIADFFNVSMDDLFLDNLVASRKTHVVYQKIDLLFSLIIVSAIWFISLIFFSLNYMDVLTILEPWRLFILALVLSLLFLCIYTIAKKRYLLIFIFASLLSWSIALLLRVSVLEQSGFLIFIINIPIQLILILLYFLLKPEKRISKIIRKRGYSNE